MSLFQCDKCGVIENTALTFGYLAHLLEPEELVKQGLDPKGRYCSECHGGKWHGKFPREVHPVGTMETDRNGNVRRRDSQP
jgi:hypothetical protein